MTSNAQLGMQQAIAAVGISPDDFAYITGFNRALDASDGEFHKAAAQVIATAYIAGGRGHEYGRFLYEKIASTPGWDTGRRALMEPVYDAMSLFAPDMVKRASGLGGAILSTELFNQGAHIAPAAWATLLSLGVLGGGAAGALHWKMNRDVEVPDEETDLLHTKARTYNQLTNEINNNLKMRGLTPG